MPDITVHQAAGRLTEAQVIDVREPHEVAQGRIPGSIPIPLGQLMGRLSELDRHRPIIAVCRSGNRSGAATQMLSRAGYSAENMAGGMLAWQAAGLPTV